jgi:aminopeptidase N
MLAPGRTTILLQLLLLAIGPAFSPAPARAAGEPHYIVHVILEPASREVQVRMSVRLPIGAEQRFGLDRGFAVKTIEIDGQTVDPAGQTWSLPTGRPVEIVYAAVLPALGAVQKSGKFAPFADPEGSYVRLAGTNSGLAGDAFTYDVTIDVPSGQRAVAPGRLVEERESEGRSIARFVFEKQVWELPVFAGPFVVGETMHGPLRLRTYFPKTVDAALGDRYRTQVAHYLDAFSTAIGTYPHSEFHVVASPLPVGLGFPTLAYVSQGILPLPFMQERSLAHEVLHAWWGNAVAVDYERGNWCEALTTFMADYALAEESGEAAAREMRRRWLADFAMLPAEQARPVKDFVARSHTASQVTGYNKGAMLFLMLRDEIGSEAFRAGLQRFWMNRRFHVASWGDLRDAFESAAGRPLDAFFRQWLERPDAPQLTLRDVERGDGTIGFTLMQPDPPYLLHVPVEIQTSSGIEHHVVRLDAVEKHYTLKSSAGITALRIDPDYRLFRRLPMDEVAPIIRSLVVAPNPVAIIADGQTEYKDVGRNIAAGLLEGAWQLGDVKGAMAENAPIPLAGTTPQVAEALNSAGLPSPPDQLGVRGTARVWMTRYRGDIPLLVVEGNDIDALRQTIGAIRHYGANSYLVFDGRKVIDRGVWQPASRSLDVDFKD